MPARETYEFGWRDKHETHIGNTYSATPTGSKLPSARHIRIHIKDGEKWSSPTSFHHPNLLRHHANGNRVDRLCAGTVVAATGSLATS